MSEERIRRNLFRSLLIGSSSMIATAAMSFVLIGLLARTGGLALVGVWTVLQSVVGLAICADLGLAPGVARRVAADGAQVGYPVLARASPLVALAGAAAAVSGLALLAAGADWPAALAFAGAGGAAQLLAQWWTSPQSGSHRHQFTFLSEFASNASQFALAVLVLAVWGGPDAPPAAALGAAILLSRLAQLSVVAAGLRVSPVGFDAWLRARHAANWREVSTTAAPFFAFALVSKLRDPLLQLAIGALAGSAALGGFTVARRIPALIHNIASAGFVALMPGYAGLADDVLARAALARNGLIGQVALLAPVLIFYLAYAEPALLLWLGAVDGDVLTMTRLFAAAVFALAASTPFFWALQAADQAVWQAKVFAGDAVAIAMAAAAAFTLLDDRAAVMAMAAVIAASTIAINLMTIHRAETRLGLARAAWRLTPAGGLAAALAAYVALAALTAGFGRVVDDTLVDLAIRGGAYGVPALVVSLTLLRTIRRGDSG